MFRKTLLVASTVGLFGCGPVVVGDPAGPQITQDVIYGHKLGMALTLDVYTPAEQNGAAIVYLNSGSWVSPMCAFHGEGSEPQQILPDACPSVNPARMLDAGYTVFNVRHGSAPRFSVSEATEDVRRALRFVQENSSSFGIDPANLGVWGASAGGQLALMLGLAPEAEGSADVSIEHPIRAIAVYMAPHSVEVEDPSMLELVPALDMPSEVQRAVSPIYYVTGDDPPTLIVHGDQDGVVPIASGQAMHTALSAAGVETEFVTLEGAGHGFTGEDADSALTLSLAWFEKHLGN